MEDDLGVRKLIELLFVKKLKVTTEMTASGSHFPTCLLANDFPSKFHSVLLARKLFVNTKWHKEFHSNIPFMLRRHDAYLIHTLGVCFKDHTSHQNVFDSFINACSIVRYFSQEFDQQTGVNFWNLNTDITMEFYKTVLKKTFKRRGGFRRLVEYIGNHRYLSWNMDRVDFVSRDESSVRLVAAVNQELHKELVKEKKNLSMTKISEHALIEILNTMVWNVLSITSVELPNLPSDPDLIKKANESRKTNTAKTTEDALLTTSVELPILPSDPDSIKKANESRKTNTAKTTGDALLTTSVELPILPSDPDSIEKVNESRKTITAKTTGDALLTTSVELPTLPSDPDITETVNESTKSMEANPTEKQERIESEVKFESLEKDDNEYSYIGCNIGYTSKNKGDIAKCKKLVQSVIEYNNLNTSHIIYSNHHIVKEAEKILEHLQDAIKSLIRILNE